MIKYFTFAELTHTDTGLPNIPTWEEVNNLMLLGSFLDTIRTEFGKPISVNSAFRCEDVNKKVGGASSSYHRKGLAADIKATRMEDLKMLLLKHIDSIDQLGVYTNKMGRYVWFHVGLPMSGKKPRNQIYYKEV